jgi:DNA-binding HxlR family transcriptional regulator
MSVPLDINALNKAFENRIRLGVMSLLLVNDKLDFNSLKDLLDVTDGNLASHLSALEKNEYISVTKQFVGKKPKTTYCVTPEGRKAFEDHLSALEKLIKMK